MIEVNVKTKNGHLFSCSKCKKFHLEFNQLGIDFKSFKNIKDFNYYLSLINGEFFEEQNKETLYLKKIHIPFDGTSIKMLLNSKDLEELRLLLNQFILNYEKLLEQQKLLNQLSMIKTDQLN